MTIQSTTAVGRRAGPLTRDRALILGGLAVVLIALIAAVAWQTRDGEERATETPVAPAVQPVAQSAATGAAVPETAQIVIVGSEAEADRLRAGLNEAEAIRGGLGLAPSNTVVSVAATDADAQRILAATDDANRIRAELGLPSMEVRDLRR